jgi:DNA-binding MarR family transcriptional regulator
VPRRKRDADHPLAAIPELIFDIAELLSLDGPTEAGLAELPASEIEIMRLVTNHPGCGITFLVARTKIRQANVSTTVRSLVERGLVIKERDENDGRAVRILPSEQALRDFDALRQVWRRRLETAIKAADLSLDDFGSLRERLHAVRDQLG